LNNVAIMQMKSLLGNSSVKLLAIAEPEEAQPPQ
jgi:hypothetical protein